MMRRWIVGALLLAAPLAWAHYYILAPYTDPAPIVGAPVLGTPTSTPPVLGAPTTSVQWGCVNAAGVLTGTLQSTLASAETVCGTAVSADGVTRFIEERSTVTRTSTVTTTTPTTTTTRTKRFELRGGTTLRVSDANAAFLIMAAGTGGGGTDPDPPEDGSNEERILSAIDNAHVPARYEVCVAVECPDDPVTTTVHNVTSMGTLATALGGSGRLINIAAGTYVGSLSCTSGQTDLDIVVSNSAIFSGQLQVTNCQRIRVTGGVFQAEPGGFDGTVVLQNSSANHILLDNVKVTDGFHLSTFTGAPHHVAIINSTTLGTAAGNDFYGLLYGGSASSVAEHLIAANVDFRVSGTAGAGVRGAVRNSIIANSRIAFPSSSNRALRLHAEVVDDTDLVLYSGLQIETSGANIWVGPEAGTPHANGITRVEFWNIDYYANGTNPNNAVMQTDSDVNNPPGITDFVINTFAAHNPYSTMTANNPTTYTKTGDTYPSWSAPPAWSGGADH